MLHITSVKNIILSTIQEVTSIFLSRRGRCSYSISANNLIAIYCTGQHNIKPNQLQIIDYNRCIALFVKH